MMRFSSLDSTEAIRMINCLGVIVIVSLTSSIFADAVNVCSVEPTAAVVTLGGRVSLNCTANGDFSINSFQVGNHIANSTIVYVSPLFGRNKAVTRNQTLADGYSVTSVAYNKTSLHMNQIKVSQAGSYVCQCGDTSRSIAKAAVVVLAAEPRFTVNPSDVTYGRPVSFSCDISFNGSSDISSNLIIKDISGTMIVNRTVCYSNNHLTFCVVNYTITANASVDQSFTCSVQLNANNSIIYSRILNNSLVWKQVTSAEIVMSSPSKCFPGKCVVTCKTDGNHGTTSYKWWQIHDNGSRSEIGNNNQTLVLTKIGQLKYQCQAYYSFRGIVHNVTSNTFITDVKAHDNSGSITLVLIGISVAIGIVIVVITIFVACICCSKQRRNRDFRAISTDESSVSPTQRQPTNRYDKPKLKNPGQQQGPDPTTSNHPVSAVPNNNKAFDASELTVVENDLYGGARCVSPYPVAPPAVCIPEENIYNEIHTLN